MKVPVLSDEQERREWLIAPRKGLLTSEFADVMDVSAAAIRAAIRRGRIPGIQLKTRGRVYAYAATVPDVAAFYGLSAESVKYLQGRTEHDVPKRLAWVGVPFLDSLGNVEISTEFENKQEYEKGNELRSV